MIRMCKIILFLEGFFLVFSMFIFCILVICFLEHSIKSFFDLFYYAIAFPFSFAAGLYNYFTHGR